MQPKEAIKEILQEVDAPPEIKQKYAERLAEDALVRDENPTTHFCSYFLPYRLKDKKVFLQAHKKSGLWLSPGGHIDSGETPHEAAERELHEELGVRQGIGAAQLLTVTYIVHDVRACKVHYDIWHFVPMDERELPTSKAGEFDDARWLTVNEAQKIVSDESNLKAIDFVEKNFFV
jgi:8-oxo-dGTP pyrophosphatase MutT (NUDIX family)